MWFWNLIKTEQIYQKRSNFAYEKASLIQLGLHKGQRLKLFELDSRFTGLEIV